MSVISAWLELGSPPGTMHAISVAQFIQIKMAFNMQFVLPLQTELPLVVIAVGSKTVWSLSQPPNSAIQGFRTCDDPEHRRLESYYYLQGKAMFQLKHRLERLKVSQPNDSLSIGSSSTSRARMTNELDGELLPDLVDSREEDDLDDGGGEGSGADADEDIEIDAGGICDGKPEATFYGSEAPNGVREFWMKLFPTKASLPQVLWHDNNCRIVAMLKNDQDEFLHTYFDSCALPVDVFHFKSKHKEGDIDCGRNCNPYISPELRTKDGKWRFNSSAAEQTNAWFGGFQSMVREMQADRYDFFLDEMILRRNKTLIADLARRGQVPYSIPRIELLKPDIDFTSSAK
ncbi:hypothetical protein B0H11DRAFT_2240333 [Mycena galericulata]|nr:hypothetical protein B0H11DRAFT_2240333 [Mycena galericulata]